MSTNEAVALGGLALIAVTLAAAGLAIWVDVRRERKRRTKWTSPEPLKRGPLMESARQDREVLEKYAIHPDIWASLTNEARTAFRDSYYKSKGL